MYRNILYDIENYTQNGTLKNTGSANDHLFIYVCMLFMYVALLNDNSPKHIYTLSVICASFADPVFFRVFRSVYISLYYIIYFYTLCILVIRTLFIPIQVKW